MTRSMCLAPAQGCDILPSRNYILIALPRLKIARPCMNGKTEHALIQTFIVKAVTYSHKASNNDTTDIIDTVDEVELHERQCATNA